MDGELKFRTQRIPVEPRARLEEWESKRQSIALDVKCEMLRRGYPIASQREEPPFIGPEKLRPVEMRYIQFEHGNTRWDQWSRFAEVCRTLQSEVQLRPHP